MTMERNPDIAPDTAEMVPPMPEDILEREFSRESGKDPLFAGAARWVVGDTGNFGAAQYGKVRAVYQELCRA